MFVRHASAREALLEYSRRFLEALGAQHAAASPLGAWTLLALLARDAEPSLRAELEQVLGCEADLAFEFVAGLLEQPHPAMSLALGAWIHEDAWSPAWTEFLKSLPTRVGRGPIPAPEEANQWIRNATGGRIQRFPVTINEKTAALMVSALTVDGSWSWPLDVSPEHELGIHGFDCDVKRVLVQSIGHSAIVRTENAGLVGVSVLEGKEAFAVVSVLAAHDVPRERAIAAAHEVALQWKMFQYGSNVSLFELPLGDGPDWTIEETEYEAMTEDARREFSRILIPAWDASESRVDLLSDPAYGFGAGAQAFVQRLRPDPRGYECEAKQIVTARFDRFGFRAAAVTGIRAAGYGGDLSPPRHRGRQRDLILHFRRPFAVVMVTKSPREFYDMHRIQVPYTGGVHPWDFVPCFTAWVTHPSEAS